MGCCNSKEAAPLDPAAFPAGASSKDEISASGGGEGPAPFSSEMLKSKGTWRNEDEAETLRLSSGDDDMERSLHIIHFNDIHNFDPLLKDNYETAAKFVTHLKSVVATVKAKYRVEPLIVFSGDFIGPSRMSTLTKGAHMVELLNLCGVHFATFGRHDFYYGYPSLKNRLNGIDDISSESASKRNMSRKGTGVKQRLSNSGLEDDKMNVRTETKWILGNILESSTRDPVGGSVCFRRALKTWKASTVVDEKDTAGLPTGNKIAGEPVDVGVAFLAVADDFLDKCSQLDIGELRYEDFIGTAKQSVRLAKESAIDTIIALTHTDIKKDYLLSLEVPEIDLILGGHDVGYKADIQNRIVKSGKDWKVSHIKLTLRSGETRPEIAVKQVTQRNGLAPDMECMKMFDKYVRIIEAKLKEVVFKTDADLDPNWNVVGTGESLLANFICDICADDYSIQEGQQDAEITILQAAVFTSNQRIEKGPITIKQIFDLFQKSQSILVVNLTGEEIVKLLEEGVQKLPEVAMELCHVSERLSYSVILPPPDEEHMDGAGANEDAESSSKADDLGSLKHRVKVRRVMFDKKPIVLKQMYKVAMTDKHLMGASWLSEAVMENPESRFFVPDIYAMRIQDLVLLYFEQHLKDEVPKWPREQVPGQVGGQVQKRINIITQEEEGVVCHGCRLWP